MQDSTFCNTRITLMGSLYVLTLKANGGNTVTIAITEKQAKKILQELELEPKEYDSKSISKGPPKEKHTPH